MQQITLKLYKFVNKIIFRSNNAKHHLDQSQNDQFKAKFPYHGVGTYGDFSHRLEVCSFLHVFIYTKRQQKRKKIERQEFEIFSLKIVNRNKTKLSYQNDCANFHYKTRRSIELLVAEARHSYFIEIKRPYMLQAFPTKAKRLYRLSRHTELKQSSCTLSRHTLSEVPN